MARTRRAHRDNINDRLEYTLIQINETVEWIESSSIDNEDEAREARKIMKKLIRECNVQLRSNPNLGAENRQVITDAKGLFQLVNRRLTADYQL